MPREWGGLRRRYICPLVCWHRVNLYRWTEVALCVICFVLSITILEDYYLPFIEIHVLMKVFILSVCNIFLFVTCVDAIVWAIARPMPREVWMMICTVAVLLFFTCAGLQITFDRIPAILAANIVMYIVTGIAYLTDAVFLYIIALHPRYKDEDTPRDDQVGPLTAEKSVSADILEKHAASKAQKRQRTRAPSKVVASHKPPPPVTSYGGTFPVSTRDTPLPSPLDKDSVPSMKRQSLQQSYWAPGTAPYTTTVIESRPPTATTRPWGSMTSARESYDTVPETPRPSITKKLRGSITKPHKKDIETAPESPSAMRIPKSRESHRESGDSVHESPPPSASKKLWGSITKPHKKSIETAPESPAATPTMKSRDSTPSRKLWASTTKPRKTSFGTVPESPSATPETKSRISIPKPHKKGFETASESPSATPTKKTRTCMTKPHKKSHHTASEPLSATHKTKSKSRPSKLYKETFDSDRILEESTEPCECELCGRILTEEERMSLISEGSISTSEPSQSKTSYKGRPESYSGKRGCTVCQQDECCGCHIRN